MYYTSTTQYSTLHLFSSLPQTQLAAELQEKVQVLDNEIEILRTTMENKEQLLQKCALVQSHKVMERDTL